MGTMYRTKDGEVFCCEHWIEKEPGERFALNENHFPKIFAVPLADLATLGDSFEFVTKYYPDFEHCQEAADLDDLDCLIDEECDDEKLARLTAVFGSDPQEWEHLRYGLWRRMLRKAIERFQCVSSNTHC